ncbi:MAG TPA: manganese efflux pump MntP family protein [Bacteroidales bacterium]|nr:manganese efflux pump MntP family protein [Bacteroidales bacterium]HPS73501.1 manganese efflux pump MntP family protein [Bacteroidales bacterium]
MSSLEIILIAIGLAMDCLAVAVSFGANRMLYGKYVFITALSFGLFQGVMPLIGWLIGDSLKIYIEQIDHWIAFGILAFIGIKMIAESFSAQKKNDSVDIRKPAVLFSLSIATSIDALITGVSFGFIEVNIILAAILITIITFITTVAGAWIGRHTTFLPAKWAERAGGLVLILIGLKIVMEHMGWI